MNNKLVRRIVLIVALAVAVYSGARLIGYIAQNARTHRINDENMRMLNATATPVTDEVTVTPEPAAETEPPVSVTEISATEQPSAPEQTAVEEVTPAPTLRSFMSLGNASATIPPVSDNLRELHRVYPNVVGWLNVHCNKRINFAIVQKNNEYYLDHDMTGAKNVTGAPFLDEVCSVWPRSENLVIYGHNMKSGEMFGELNRLRDRTVLASDPFVTFSTLYETDEYAPLYIGICSVYDVPFYRQSFADENEFDSFISILRQNSEVRLNTDAIYGDDLLTLVTCCDGSDDKRMVVVLRKIRENENLTMLKRSIFPSA
ncbi:MAG: class B sortase [Clostridia bacterium]|nr:class B sortase [Clostridia bacterium]